MKNFTIMLQRRLMFSAFAVFKINQCQNSGVRRRQSNFPVNDIHAQGNYQCPKCQNSYRWYRGLHRHLKYECGKAPRFKCPYCGYIGKHRSHVYSHIKTNHRDNPVYALDMQDNNKDL